MILKYTKEQVSIKFRINTEIFEQVNMFNFRLEIGGEFKGFLFPKTIFSIRP